MSEDYIDEEKHKIIKEVNRIIDSFREDELGITNLERFIITKLMINTNE